MARYYFNLQNGIAFPDRRGKELGSLQQARNAAIDYAVEMLRSPGACCWRGLSTLQVANERGAVLFTLSFCGTEIASGVA
jgi:hypothetical protein